MLSPGSVEIVAQKKGETSVYSVCTLNVVTPKAMAKDFLLSTVCFISMMQKNMSWLKRYRIIYTGNLMALTV